MIKIPFSYVADKVNASAIVQTGLRFMDTICEELVVPNGLAPIIGGGAARDVVIKEVAPHDVDIFFVRTHGTSGDRAREMAKCEELRDNIVDWLEDRDITWRSLLQTPDQQSSYMNADGTYTYREIMDFTYEDVNIQIMIHMTPKTMDQIVEKFPIMCRTLLARSGFYTVSTGFCAAAMDRPVMISERDLSYCRKKYPGQQGYAFSSANEMYYQYMMTHDFGPLESVSIPEAGRQFTSWPETNRVVGRFHRAVRAFFGLPDDFGLPNQHYNEELGGTWNTDRRSNPRPVVNTAVRRDMSW